MKSLKEYRVSYSGLKLGKHQFDFEVDDRFFEEFEYSLVKRGNIKVGLELDKQETMMIFYFVLEGEIYLDCDVCLAPMPVKVDFKERQIVKFTEDETLEDDTEEIIVLGKNEHTIDLSTLIYEYINLAVPYYHKCSDQGKEPWCDKQMLAHLGNGGVDVEEEQEEETGVDPRWAALKNIKDNNLK